MVTIWCFVHLPNQTMGQDGVMRSVECVVECFSVIFFALS